MSGKNATHIEIAIQYEAAKKLAAQVGFELSLANPFFVLREAGATVRTFTDIAHIEAFLSGALQVREARRKAVN